jgi:preprotein translocase subunit YajC
VRPENLLLLVMLGGLLFLMFSRTRKQQREMQQVQAGLTVGAEVMTTAGLYATVVALDDQTVLLETAPGQRSRWDRRAVARILDTTSAPPPLGSGAAAADLWEGGGASAGQHGDDGDESDAGPPGPPSTPPDRV